MLTLVVHGNSCGQWIVHGNSGLYMVTRVDSGLYVVTRVDSGLYMVTGVDSRLYIIMVASVDSVSAVEWVVLLQGGGEYTGSTTGHNHYSHISPNTTSPGEYLCACVCG